MPESLRKLVPYSKLRRKGNKVYHLNIGQPDIKTPEVAMNAVRNFDVKVLEYSHSAGFESYRSKLAQFYTNQGLPINVEDIITTGGSEALLLQWEARWIGDEIIIPEPFYANYNGFLLHLELM
jgi:aspartate aminotransferase